MKQYLAKKFPVLYKMRLLQFRLQRHLQNLNPNIKFALTKSQHKLDYPVKKHQSLLLRRLGTTDPQLQYNKIVNLKLSSSRINGVIIRPGETFSFWKLVGKPTASKGYIEGLLLSQGNVSRGIGGGICQLANLLFWLILHTPMEIRERHHHSFDPFPDDRRVLPFGSGASVFYNYVDLRFYNPTDTAFQIHVWVTDAHLKGSIQCESNWSYSYHIEERYHQFIKQNGKNYRKNEIWRKTIDKATGNTIKQEMMIRNFSEVKYEIECVDQPSDACGV